MKANDPGTRNCFLKRQCPGNAQMIDNGQTMLRYRQWKSDFPDVISTLSEASLAGQGQCNCSGRTIGVKLLVLLLNNLIHSLSNKRARVSTKLV